MTRRGALRSWLEAELRRETDACIDGWPFGVVDGYPSMTFDGRSTYLNRYVCERFHGPPPSPTHQAAHSCGRRICLNPRHLRWATPAENWSDRILHGTDLRGERAPRAKLTEAQVREIREARGRGETLTAIGSRYGVTDVLVSRIARRDLWKHVP
jgi:hypothetical protein